MNLASRFVYFQRPVSQLCPGGVERQWNQFRFSEPVLVNGRLSFRDMDASDIKQSLYGVLGVKGNLTCLDLNSR